MKIACFTNDYDTKQLKKYDYLNLKFVDSFSNLPQEADFYLVSLRLGSSIYNDFIHFMRNNSKSKFIFLNEFTNPLTDEDLDIRNEPNTYTGMYVPETAIELIMELVSSIKVFCYTNRYDTKELKKYNDSEFYLDLNFVRSFDDLPQNANFYIVSLRYGSRIYHKFVDFMRKNPTSKFVFLNEFTKSLTLNDFNIRDEPNTYSGMYIPDAALELVTELVLLTNI
jgi:hypothetical protein